MKIVPPPLAPRLECAEGRPGSSGAVLEAREARRDRGSAAAAPGAVGGSGERTHAERESRTGRPSERARPLGSPGSRAARTSRVPHARLLLDTLDRPADALDGFSAYLDADPRGTLSEEAQVGRAQALRRLGRGHVLPRELAVNADGLLAALLQLRGRWVVR